MPLCEADCLLNLLAWQYFGGIMEGTVQCLFVQIAEAPQHMVMAKILAVELML